MNIRMALANSFLNKQLVLRISKRPKQANRDGSTATYEVTMNRKGDMTSRVVASTGATAPRAPSADPWGN